MKAIRPIRIDGDIAYIPLTGGHYAIIDSSDVKTVMQKNWHARITYTGPYATGCVRNSSGQLKQVSLHRVLLNAAPGYLEVDHINGNTLDNRRSNLRFATHRQNLFNSKRPRTNKSGYKGVFWDKFCKRWRATIKIHGKSTHLGCFATAVAAHESYVMASKAIHGEFSRLQ